MVDVYLFFFFLAIKILNMVMSGLTIAGLLLTCTGALPSAVDDYYRAAPRPSAKPNKPMLLFGNGTVTPGGVIAGASEPSLLFVPPGPGAPNGTLLAVTGGHLPCQGSGCPGATLLLRRSGDRGATWSAVTFPFLNFSNDATIGSFFQNQLTWDSGAETVLLTIGNITFNHNTCNGPHSGLEDADGMLVIRSTNRGETWSAAENVQRRTSGSPTTCLAPTTGHGVCMDNGHTPTEYRNRIVTVGVHNAYHGDVLIRSDDHGATWQASAGLYVEGVDEGSVAQVGISTHRGSSGIRISNSLFFLGDPSWH